MSENSEDDNGEFWESVQNDSESSGLDGEGVCGVAGDLDLIEASAAELLSLATRIRVPYFKGKILKLAGEAYDLVQTGSALFDCDDDLPEYD